MGRQLLSLGPARPPRGRLLGPPRAIGIAWPFQATSREMVETALPSRAAIWRSESPAINPRESSLRSAKDNRRGDRARDRGIMPPVRAMNRWIDLVEHPTAAAALAKVSPSETRRWISTWSSWLSRLPWSARRRCISPPPNPWLGSSPRCCVVRMRPPPVFRTLPSLERGDNARNEVFDGTEVAAAIQLGVQAGPCGNAESGC